jgi:hypothetical protein
MKMALWAGAALACGGLAACGSTSKTVTVTKTVAAAKAAADTRSAPATTSTVTTTSGGVPECTQELTDTLQGKCAKDGETLVFTGRDKPLVMKTQKITYKSLRTAKSTASSDGESRTAQGVFVIISVTFENRTDSPQMFQGAGDETAFLLLDNKQYTQDQEAADQADDAAFEYQIKTVQPGEKQTGDLVFDLPKDKVADLKDHGVLGFLDLGRAYDDKPPLGLFRLYG